MKNSNASEKSKGVVVFAFNTSHVDYVALADETSKLTSHHLKLPITLVTDYNSKPKFDYDKIVRVNSQSGNTRTDNGVTKEWRNFGRYMAYELSPYDTTILLDSDYLVLDQSLLMLLEQDFDYRLMHNSHNYKETLYQKMGEVGLPFVWATVVLFRKSSLTEQYFNLIRRVQRNYSYYKTLFNGNGTYRNDYAFAIANIILNGYSLEQHKSVPWSMLTVEESIEDIEIKNDFLVIRHTDRAEVVSRQNIHVMDKDYLMTDKFKEFVRNVL
jgi:hypothetical protein